MWTWDLVDESSMEERVPVENRLGGLSIATVIFLVIGVLIVSGSVGGRAPKEYVAPKGCVGSCAVVELSGAGNRDGIYEVPEGISLGEFLKGVGLMCEGGCDRPLEGWIRIEWRTKKNGESSPILKGMREATKFLMGKPMNINRAEARDLSLLEGIGPVLAARIVRDRRTKGPFHCPEDLVRVKGIGPGKVERIRPFLSFEQ